MKFLNNLPIGRRLALGFAVVLAATLVIATAAILRLDAIAASTRAMMQAPLAKERMMTEWHTQTYAAIRRTAAIVKSSDPSLVEFFKEDGTKTAARSTALIKQIEPLLEGDGEKALFKRITDLRKTYTDAKNKAVKARADGNIAEAERLLTKAYMPASDDYERALAELVDMQRRHIDAIAGEIDSQNRASSHMIAMLATVAVLSATLFAWMLTTGIVRPIREAVELAQTVASGDLSRTIDATTHDETGALLRALRDMNGSLARIVTTVRTGTTTINDAAGEIASGNLDLSERTEQQAAALEETSSSMAQLTDIVRQNAEHARQANQLSIAASNVASEGGAVVGEVVATMGSIHASARKIVDIIAVIDGIAFQTNILALNAAVEAARAGEQGRGFAVVAGEVRTLAQRSAAAAKEIKELIGASVEQVEIGNGLVDRAGATMTQVVGAIQRVTDIMADIAAASHEQSDSIAQVSRAIGAMDDGTQQNAALVEEAAASAAAMRDQAVRLASAVDVFKLGHDTPAAAPDRRPPDRRPPERRRQEPRLTAHRPLTA